MGPPPPQGYRIWRLLVVSTEGPLDFARGKLRPERRDQFQSQSILRICASSGRMSFAGRYAREGRGSSVLPAQARACLDRSISCRSRASSGKMPETVSRTRSLGCMRWLIAHKGGIEDTLGALSRSMDQVPARVDRHADFLIVIADAADLATAR